MNVHDWLANLPFSDPGSVCSVVEISFNNGSRKDYYRNSTLHHFEKGDMVAVEGVSGFDVGSVNLTGELVRLQLKKRNIDERNPDIKKILRRAGDQDVTKWQENKRREPAAMIRSRAIARQLNLQMKVCEVEFQADGKKATFFYTADDRVDFRELIKVYASEFRVKVEMRQIGIRQEAAKVGGIGSCGRELCCSTWLTDFKSVNTTAARYQNLSINQTKLSGQCGRLKCCLNYELDTYLDALQSFPDNAETLHLAKGAASLAKKDIFRNLMWYTLPESNKQYPLTVDRVKEILRLNRQGIQPEELQIAEVSVSKSKEAEPEHVELVGQISLRSLERNSKKRKQKERENRRDRDGKRTEGRGDAKVEARQGGGDGGRRDGNRPGGNRPEGSRPEGKRSEGGRGDGNRNEGGRGDGNRGDANRDQQRRDRRPDQGRKPEGVANPEGAKPDGAKKEGNRNDGGRGDGNRGDQQRRDRRPDQGRKPEGDQPRGERPQGGGPREGGQPREGGGPRGNQPPGGNTGGQSQGGGNAGGQPQSGGNQA